MGHEREGTLSPLISSLIQGWRIVCSMCCGAVLASERMLWMKLFKSTAKICKRERERDSSVWLWWRCFIYFYHLSMNYWSWNWEDIFLGVWADSVLSYIKFKPFWERRTVLLPQIFRLKTWQRDPTATTEKHIRRWRLWCFGPSNRTILYKHLTRAWSLIGIANINAQTQGLKDYNQSHTLIDNRLPTDSDCTTRFFLAWVDRYWYFKSGLTELQASKCLDVHFHVWHMWCLWQNNSLVQNFQHTSGFLGVDVYGFGFQILGCTKWILTCRITSTLEDGWHPHANCRQPLMEWTKQQNKPTISDRSRWKDAGLLSGGEIWMGSMSSIPAFV